MAALYLVAPHALSGKTTVAAAIAARLRSEGREASLQRSGEDLHAGPDRHLFGRMSTTGAGDSVVITELAAGEPAPDGGRVLVVAGPRADPSTLSALRTSQDDASTRLLLNRVPSKRAAEARSLAEGLGLPLAGMWPEDRVLASPTIGQVAEAIGAEARFLNSSAGRPVDRTLIAPISADPGQGYFARTGANTVIVRSDKPDLQLAALNAGASALIITGGLPILGYVLERAEEEHIPLIRTRLGTVEAITQIEGLFAGDPFSGSDEQTRRATRLAAELDLTALLD